METIISAITGELATRSLSSFIDGYLKPESSKGFVSPPRRQRGGASQTKQWFSN
uniref:Uncharacterized protein n=1 Tax=Arundo donax TaxID=35708 RepID=A0A0A9BRN3_ARUDO